MIKFPYARPDITKEDKKEVFNSLNNQFLTGGPIIKKFEDAISRNFKSKYTIVCNSGTAALHLIYLSLGLKKGDTILTSPITFVATANAAKMCGAEVIFADVDPSTGLLTPENVERAIKKHGKRIKVISIVHLGGRLCDLEGISKIAKKYKCKLVEDACHAPGATYFDKKNKGHKIGSCKYSIASSFSFHAIKHITMGEGGCVTTNNKKISNIIRNRLNHSMIKEDKSQIPKKKFSNPWYYEIREIGWNYRANEINCALGLSQLKRLNKLINKRIELAKIYKHELRDLGCISFPKDAFLMNNNAWHLFTIFIDFKKLNLTRKEIMKKLEKKGIGSQVHYIPLFSQPLYRVKNYSRYVGALEYYKKNLSIPLYASLTKKNITFICNSLREVIK